MIITGGAPIKSSRDYKSANRPLSSSKCLLKYVNEGNLAILSFPIWSKAINYIKKPGTLFVFPPSNIGTGHNQSWLLT